MEQSDPPLAMMYSLIIGSLKNQDRVAKWGVMPGKMVEKPVASVQKLQKAPKVKMPWG